MLLSMEVVRHLGGVIDLAEGTIEFRNFQNDKVPLEVVAGHLTMDLKPKHASALLKQLTPQMWEEARKGQEVTTVDNVFRKKWFGFIINHTSYCNDSHIAK